MQYVTCHLKEEAHPVLEKLPQSWPEDHTLFLLMTQAVAWNEVSRKELLDDVVVLIM